jgi:N-acetylneuraminate synthase
MEPEEFALLLKEGTRAATALGTPDWRMQDSEMESRRLRRSLYIVGDVKAGEIVTLENVRAIRPGGGCAPKLLETVIGKKFRTDCLKGTPLSLDLIGLDE